MTKSTWRRNEGTADVDFIRCQMQARGCSVEAELLAFSRASTCTVPGAFQDNAVVGGEVWLCLKFGHHHLWTQWFTSQENGLEEFNHFIGLKQNVWHTTESSLLSLCHLTWTNKGDIFIPMDQGMLVTALTVEKTKMVYVCDKPFRDRLETSLSMRCNLKQYQGLNLHCYQR